MQGTTPVRKWEKKRERNEALDCRVYAMAALDDLQPDWKRIARNFEARAERLATPAKPAEDEATAPPLPVADSSIPVVLGNARPKAPEVRRPGGWVNSWKSL